LSDSSLLRRNAEALARILGFLAVSGVAVGVLQLLATYIAGAPHGDVANAVLATLALLISTAFFVKIVDRKPWSAVWLDASAADPRKLGLGFVLGAFAIGIPTAMLILAHWLVNSRAAPGSWIAAAVSASALLLPAALLEELSTRGYILSVLRDVWGWYPAVIVTSIVFGLLHLMNNGVSVQSVLLVILAGFFLAAVLFVTKSLYAAWMAHFAWNWTMAAVFHVAVSGIPLKTPNYRYVDAGPNWATGGVWGPEGGIFAGLGMLAGLAVLYPLYRSSLFSLRSSQTEI
jgi:membrane protease YdiL (CAAX protease family)